jgi:uncharacterized glyoxalase superfamily protein PhnB
MPIQPDMVGIVVKDMGRALAFYRLLGLPIAEGQDDEPYVEVSTTNGYRISWNTEAMVTEIDPEWQPPTGQRVSLAFKCDFAREVDSTVARLAAAGYVVHKAPWDAFWGQRYAVVLDPDGSTVDVFAAI